MNQIALIIGSLMIALGLIAAAVVPLVAQEPTPTPTPTPTPEGITPAGEDNENVTTDITNASEMTPATKR